MSAASVVRLSRSATSVVAKAASGFHLLRIDGYSQAKVVRPGQKISSMGFTVGGESWRMDYYPNGRDASARSDHASVYVQLTHDRTRRPVEAWYKFSLLDHAGNTAYELPAETASFAGVPQQVDDRYYANPLYFPHARMPAFRSPAAAGDDTTEGPGCGHEQFIGREKLEHLIRDDFLVVRCDLGLTQMTTSRLAAGEINNWEDEEEEQGYFGPPAYPPRRSRRRRQPDDGEYVKWCLVQRPGEPRIRQGPTVGDRYAYER